MGGSSALQRAAVLAMRDAAALMIDKLDRETGVGSTRRGQAPAVTAAPEPAAPPTAGDTRNDFATQVVRDAS